MMNTVASRLDKKLHGTLVCILVRCAVGERDVRDDEVDKTVCEEERCELRATAFDAFDALDELVHAEEEDDEVEAHRVDERRGEYGVIGARHEAAFPVDPCRFYEHTCKGNRVN